MIRPATVMWSLMVLILPLSFACQSTSTTRERLLLNQELCAAAQRGDVSALTMLFQKKLSPNVKNQDGNTPLHLAVQNEYLEVVDLLLQKGAFVNARNNLGNTALHQAVIMGSKDLVNKLLTAGASPNAANLAGETPLMSLLQVKDRYLDPEELGFLIEKGADLKATERKYGLTPLHIATDNRQSSTIIKYLIEHGASLEVVDKFGRTALQMARARDFKELVSLLDKTGNATGQQVVSVPQVTIPAITDVPVAATTGSKGSDQGQFQDPKDIAVNSSGEIYIADSGNHRIQHFDSDGVFIRAWGQKGQNEAQFNMPSGMAIDLEGNVYVADTWNHRIQKFDAKGQFLGKWGDDTKVWAPKDVLVDTQGFIYVVDTGYHRIHKLGPDFSEIGSWAGKGEEPGKLFEPVGIALSPDGLLYIADTANKRISIFDRSGKFSATWPVHGWEEFYSEPYLTFTQDGTLLASDSRNHRLLIFSSSGQLLAQWQESTPAAKFQLPLGVAADRKGSIWVVNSFSGQVRRFDGFESKL